MRLPRGSFCRGGPPVSSSCNAGSIHIDKTGLLNHPSSFRFAFSISSSFPRPRCIPCTSIGCRWKSGQFLHGMCCNLPENHHRLVANMKSSLLVHGLSMVLVVVDLTHKLAQSGRSWYPPGSWSSICRDRLQN
jgi:hypothetical protein